MAIIAIVIIIVIVIVIIIIVIVIVIGIVIAINEIKTSSKKYKSKSFLFPETSGVFFFHFRKLKPEFFVEWKAPHFSVGF